VTELIKRIHALLDEAIATNPEARQWLNEWFETTLVWDHVVDDDPIDKEQTHRVFKALVCQWAFNQFWIDHRASLVPSLVTAISAWDFSNLKGESKIHAYEMYTNPITTVLFIVGGIALVDQHMPQIRRLLIERMEEDDLEDGGKK